MKSIIKKALARYNREICRIDPDAGHRITPEDFYSLYFASQDPESFFFVQIGAGDGKEPDPIYPYVTKYNLQGIAIEPVPTSFEKLKQTYEEYPVQCVQAAITPSNEGEEKIFYTVREDTQRYDEVVRCSSFEKERVIHALEKRGLSHEYIMPLRIPTMSFDTLVAKYGVSHIDMLQLDCEGYDWKILSSIDIKKYSPSLINFESHFLNQEEKAVSEMWLQKNGYASFRTKSDTTAYKTTDGVITNPPIQ